VLGVGGGASVPEGCGVPSSASDPGPASSPEESEAASQESGGSSLAFGGPDLETAGLVSRWSSFREAVSSEFADIVNERRSYPPEMHRSRTRAGIARDGDGRKSKNGGQKRWWAGWLAWVV